MQAIEVLSGQTWVDIALQELGDEARVFELCDLNNASITDEIAPGTTVNLPNYETSKRSIINLLKVVKPASAIVVQSGGEVQEGIEFWAIETDFVVS